MTELSPLQQARLKFQPVLPQTLASGITKLNIVEGNSTESVADQNEIKGLFPNTYGKPMVTFEQSDNENNFEQKNVGVILSGGQAPGGHNVVAGIYDALKQANPQNKLYGFLGGPAGIIDGKYIELTDEIIDAYRNTGGFDIIGSGRTKLETEEQFQASLENCKKLNITGIVIIGGDDSNTNAAMLAEWFKSKNAGIQVIGCPKTIDGDLKNEQIEISFGFDTATKTYSELVGNIQRDVNSAKKYWHFIKLMGRSATHVGLEVALQTQPNITLISEEVAEKSMSLNEIVDYMADIIVKRSKLGKNFGVALIPEGLIEFVPEMKAMIANLNDLMPVLEEDPNFTQLTSGVEKEAVIEKRLRAENAAVFRSLPAMIKAQLLMDRDPHGNVQVSKIETEKGHVATDEEIAEELEITVDELNSWQGQTKASNLISLDEYTEMGSEAKIESVTNTHFDQPEEVLEKEELKIKLTEAINSLTEKERNVITLYYYEEMTLKEISLVLNVSESRVSQLHTKALGRMRKTLGEYLDIIL